jgi:uncharacterized membrane protein YozB (DUF420 family)
MLTIISAVLVLAGVCLKVWRSRIIAWSLFVMFSILAVAWGFMSVVSYRKPFTKFEVMVLWVIAAIFSAFAIWSLVVAVRANKKRDNEVV